MGRGNPRKCSVDYSAAGGTTIDTFEVGATTAASENTACTASVLIIHNINEGTGISGTRPHSATGKVCQSVFAAIDGTVTNAVIKQSGPPFFITHLTTTASKSGFEEF